MAKKPPVTKVVLKVATRKVKKEKGPPRGTPFQKGNPRAWKPGQSGNPSGRPKGSGTKTLSVAYSATLEQVVPDFLFDTMAFLPWKELQGMGFTFADLIALGQARSAVEGNTPAAKEMREVTEGKVADELHLTGKDGENLGLLPPVALSINFVKPKQKKE